MKPVFHLLGILLLIIPSAPGQEEEKAAPPETATPQTQRSIDQVNHAAIMVALQTGDADTFLKLTENTDNETYKGFRLLVLQGRGEQRFAEGNIKGALADFDEVIALEPKRDHYHWQRGIALYYADRFQEGKEQFQRHQKVNNQDVENAVWHFLCSVRAPGGSIESARKNFIPISKDSRVPMKEIHSLFAGTGSAEAVLDAARKEGNPKRSSEAKNACLYAHLYLGLYHEATGKPDLMKQHISKATSEYKMDHYMGRVAQVHAKLRGLEE